MDFNKIAFDLKTSNSEEATRLLKELFESQEVNTNKGLFEVLYDLKFHNDLGVKFWAKKVLNKLEVKYNAKGQSDEHPPITEEPPPIPDTTQEDLLKKMIDTPQEISLEDLKVMCEKPRDEIKVPLMEFLKNCQDNNQLSFLTKSMGKSFPSEEILLSLAPFLRHEDFRVVANTVEGIDGINSPKAFVLLSQMLEHPDNRVQSNVAVAIGRFSKEEAIAVIERMLQLTGKAHMQISACHAIKEIREKKLLPNLIEFFSDPFLFQEALKVFEAIPCSDSVKLLQSSLAQIVDDKQKGMITRSIDQILKAMDDAASNPQQSERKFSPWMFVFFLALILPGA